jgi:ribbon-helix-helix CopG family protein
MPSTRTQIYLTAEQRKRLDARVRRDGKTLAQVIRDAVDQYLEGDAIDPEEALRVTFGASPDLEVPNREDWDRGYG